LPAERDDLVLVCDLDESLVTVNTFPVFARFALGELVRSRRPRAAATLARAAAARRLGRLSHVAFKAELTRQAQSLPSATLRDWASRLLEQHLNPRVAATVRDWNGIRVLSTAAPQVYAELIGELIGFDHVHGSLLLADGFHDNSGSAKVARLAELFELPIELAITDDVVTDAPLLAAARRQFVVEPAVG
jgi:phosphoserine phosphatase